VSPATTVAATAPVAPKAASAKGAAAPQASTTTSPASDTTTDAPDQSTTAAASTTPALNNAAPQPAAVAKPEAGNGSAEAAQATISDSAPLSAAATGRDRGVSAAAGPTPAGSSDAGLQATAALQPQLPATSSGTASPGTLSVTPATGAAIPLSGLAVEIAASAKSGKTSFEIRLDPADLGRIDVRIDVDRSGQVTSHLTVEKPETLSMLRQDAPQLQRALDDAGLKTGSGGLQFSLRDQSSSGQNGGNQTAGNAQRLVISDDDAVPAMVAGRSYGRMLGASGGVDIRV
jgi:flagellar hook-length control protein FliK